MALIKHDERYGPYMTANNAPVPYAATASQNNWGAFRAFSENLEDDISFTGLAAGAEQWVQIKLDAPIRIWAFRIACRTTVSAKDAGQVPKNFTVQGSVDGTAFEDIRSYTDMLWEQFTSWDAAINKYDWSDSKKIEITCTKEYQYYRFLFGECQAISTQKLGSMTPTSANTIKPTLIDLYQVEGEESPEITVTGIRITHLPDKTRYEIGAELDATGLEVMADMSDGTAQAVTDYTLSGYDSATTGQKTVTVTYQGRMATFVVSVYELSSIAITTPPDKVQYNVGETLDLTGMVVTATYSDGITEVVTDYTVSGYDSSVAGTCTVVVAYQGETVSFEATVVAASHILRQYIGSPNLEDVVAELDTETWVMTISGTGAIKDFSDSDVLDMSGGMPSIHPPFFKDQHKSIRKIIVENGVTHIGRYTIYGYASDKLFEDVAMSGAIPPDAKFEQYCAALEEIHVAESVVSATSKTAIGMTVVRESINTGGIANLYGPDRTWVMTGTWCPVIYTKADATQLDGLRSQDVKGLIVVKDALVEASGYGYIDNGEYVTVTGKCGVALPGDTSATIDVSQSINNKPVKCIDGHTSFPLSSGSIINVPSCVDTITEYSFANDASNITVNIDSPENRFTGSPWGAEGATVNWTGVAKQLTGITISSLPTKTQYLIGEEFDSTGLVVSATYSDDTTEVTADYTLSGFDSTTVGSKAVIVTYQGLTESFEIWVHEASTVLTEYIGASSSKDIVATLYTSTELVEISGKGRMKSFRSELSLFENKKISIKSIVISPGVTSIGNYTFYNYTGLTNIAIPESVTSIGDATFYNCTSLTDITIPDSVRSIGIHAFNGCIGLTTMTIPDAVTSIGDYAFRNCAGLADIILPQSLTSIGVSAFGDCTRLTDITIPGATDIKKSAFGGCTGITSVTMPSVTGIGEAVFEGCTSLMNITIPETVTSIGRGCFTGCIGLTNITIPDSVTEIGQSAFEDCSGITDITIPNNVVSIERYTFKGCTSLTRVTIPDTVTVIKMFAFNGCASLTDITIPGTVTEIWQSVFDGCTSLTNVTIPESVTTIESFTFRNCTSLTDITIPDSVKSIGVSAFDGCIGLTTMTIPESVTTIGRDAFNGCTGLTTITIPNSVKSIGNGCFTACVLLARIDIRNTQDSIPGAPWGAPNATVNWLVAITLESVLNTTKGMKVIRNNVENDDGTDTVTGVDWFMYSGNICRNIYVSGNNWIGLGASTEHLKICRRNGTVYYVYRQESVLDNSTKFLKIRVEGYTYIGGTDVSKKLVYELFLFDNNDMFLNVITSPTNGIYIGTSSITCNGITTALNIPVNATANGPLEISFINKDDRGMEWDIVYVPYSFSPLSGIKISCLPGKTKYIIDDEFDPAGLIVTANYGDGTTKEVTDYTISGFDSSTAGTKTITVTYQGFTATFEITVAEAAKKLVSVSVTAMPAKTQYLIGEEFNSTGLVVSATYSDGSSAPITGYTLSGFDSTQPGMKLITVTYKEHATSFEVGVYGATTGIRIAQYPNKVYYRLNETLDATGLQVVATTEGGADRPITDYTLSTLDSSTVGNKWIIVTYETPVADDTTAVYTAYFAVKVTATGDNPFEDTTELITVTVHWPNGEFADLTNTDLAGGTGVMELRESICSDNYFIFGGCISNMLKFTTHSNQFLSTEESAYPHGDIEVYVECKGTRVKIFTGAIDSGKRRAGLTQRDIIAYDKLYKFRNTDIAWWYKNKTTDKQMVLTQKQFRDELFSYLGIEQVPTKLYYDDAYVPNTNISGELNAVRIIKDMCLQNNVFGWMNRDGKFEYLKLPENSREKSHDNAGNVTYEYFPATVYVDNYESCDFTEGRIWYPKEFYSDPNPQYGFSSGPPNAQEAYERNVYYNRNSFFIGNADWLDYAWKVNEYGVATIQDPAFPICFGPFADIFRLYRAQGYNVTVRGNPLNQVGDTIEITVRKTADDGTQLEWVIHSYIMSRTLKILGDTSMYDTYSARNAPYNGNNTQAGTYTPELSAEMFRARAEGPVISYADFDDGTAELKKDRYRCKKLLTEAEFEAIRAAGATRTDTEYCIILEG